MGVARAVRQSVELHPRLAKEIVEPGHEAAATGRHDVSRDEPFLIPVNGKPFAVVPYTLGMNDIVQFEGRNVSAKSFFALERP